MKNILLYLVLCLGTCNTTNQKLNNDVRNDSRFFEDIDIYNLKGVREIKKGTYNNYIEIENVNDSLCNVTYHDSLFVGLNKRFYKKKFNYWWCRYESGYDSCGPIVYEYILPNEVIELSYCQGENSVDSTLLSVNLFKDSLSISYTLPNGFHCQPGINSLKTAQLNYQSIFTQVMNLNNDTLIIYETTINNRKDILDEATSCWKSKYGNRSYYWWSYFKWGQNKIVCKL